MPQKFVCILLLSVSIYASSIASNFSSSDIMLQQRDEVFQMSQEIVGEANEAIRIEKTARILAAKYAELFVHLTDYQLAFEFAYKYLHRCMTLGRNNDRNWEHNTQIPFAFHGISFNHIYASQGNALFDKVSTSVVWLLIQAFETNSQLFYLQDRTILMNNFSEFFNKLLYWTGMARAAIYVLSEYNKFSKDKTFLYGSEGEKHGVHGMFVTTSTLKEPWVLSSKLQLLWKYLFEWNMDETVTSYHGGILEKFGQYRIIHSRSHASITALESFYNAFMLFYQNRHTKNISKAVLTKKLLQFVYDMSWSSTCERGQGAMLNWIINALSYWGGFEIKLPHETKDKLEEILLLFNRHIKEEKTNEFLLRHYSQPDVIALCCPTPWHFLKNYALQLKQTEPIQTVTWQAPQFNPMLPKKIDLSFKTIESSIKKLHSVNISNITELRMCNILSNNYEECEYDEYLEVLRKSLIAFPHLSKLVISRLGPEILDIINELSPNLETIELNEVVSVEGVNFKNITVQLPIKKLIITNNNLRSGFPAKGITLLEKTFEKIKFLEIPFYKIVCDLNPILLSSHIWKKMKNLEEIHVNINTSTHFPFVEKNLKTVFDLLSNCPNLPKINVKRYKMNDELNKLHKNKIDSLKWNTGFTLYSLIKLSFVNVFRHYMTNIQPHKSQLKVSYNNFGVKKSIKIKQD